MTYYDTLDEDLKRARRALQRIMQCLGPDIPELVAGAAEGMQAEIAEALSILREAGIEYQHHPPSCVHLFEDAGTMCLRCGAVRKV